MPKVGKPPRRREGNEHVRTYGLTHINLVVRDLDRSLRFYRQVFGVAEYGRTEGLVHTRTPGCQDVITFDEQASGAGESRGIAHFGFRLVSPGDIDAAVDEVEHAGGKLLRRGEFSPGYPYAYVADPDAMRSRFGMSEAAALGHFDSCEGRSHRRGPRASLRIPCWHNIPFTLKTPQRTLGATPTNSQGGSNVQ